MLDIFQAAPEGNLLKSLLRHQLDEPVPHFDSSGRSRSLFPINPEDRHIPVGKDRCSLLDLAGMVSHAKYRGLLSSVGMKPRGSDSGSMARVIERVKSIKLGRADRIKHESQEGTQNLKDMDPITGPPAEGDIPAFFRHRAEKNSFGDEHMALRIGPLVIENGVESTKSDALITLREPPVFHECFEHAANQPALAVEGTPERLLWQQLSRPVSQPKRYKAIMKQVAGVPFSGLESEQDREQEIIKLVVEASQSATVSSESDLQQHPDSHISQILDQLQDLFLRRVRVYLSSITSQLLNPSTSLTWNPITNTSHSFCASLLDPTLFTPLVNGPPINPNIDTYPLYLISFYTPPLQPSQHPMTETPIPRTKHDIPPGHIQESLIQPSTSPSSDLIDSLTHYFTDWASFPRPLYPHQLLFPWDCTEGYARCPMACGECTLSTHVWAFPFDSWSLVSLHLGREKHLYPFLQGGDYNHLSLRRAIHAQIQPSGLDADPDPSPNSVPQIHEEWIQNRLSILHASWILARTASSMAQSLSFRKSTTWIPNPSSSTLPAMSTVKQAESTAPNRIAITSSAAQTHITSYLRRRGKIQTQGWSSRTLKKKNWAGSGDRSCKGFEGEDSTRFTGKFQIFYNASYTPGSGSAGVDGRSECVDAQFGSIVGLTGIGQFGGEKAYDPAMDPGVNCASGCGSSSMPSGDGSGSGGGGGWGDGGGGGYSGGGGGGGGSSSGGDGGGSSGGGDGGGGGGGDGGG
ncbi:uncharacterized protein KD926_008839 [Aspergillus affinis]|uniref:uncharacterized protein n=1 Tax=Aspergillus affinis TaxID=1070780 RepID=UPI0022FDCE07|nr:uncharacterized protein KD926_008839 [Aspergillus affinis]KAI9045412.1 hypothetical protein KD926_008839 [Aspergillus affinis]